MGGKTGTWSHKDRMEALRQCRLFATWPDERLADLAMIAYAKFHPRGAEIFARDPEHREAFVIAAGEVEIGRESVDGRRFVLSVQGPHEILAVVRLLAAPPIHYVYRAYEDTVLLHLPCDALTALLDSDPILWRDVALLMCARQGESLRQLDAVRLGTLEQQLARTLIDLSLIHGIERPDEVELGLRLPQEQLAAMLGISRQSVNKLLRKLEEEAIIALDYNRITILRPAALEALAHPKAPKSLAGFDCR